MNKPLIVIKLLMFIAVITSALTLENDLMLRVPEGWSDMGPSEPDQMIILNVALKLTNIDLLEKQVQLVSNPDSKLYGQYWTPQQTMDYTAPTPKSLKIVKTWILQSGVKPNQITYLPSGFYELNVSVQQAQDMLKVQYNSFRHNESDNVIHRSLSLYNLPEEVRECVDLVGGVIRFPKMNAMTVDDNDADADAPLVTPKYIRDIYNITDIPNANPKNLQAVVSFLDQYFNPSDLTDFQQKYHLPETPIEKILGPNKVQTNPGIEASLDVQYLTGIPGNIRTWVYSTSGQVGPGNEPFLTWLSHIDDTTEVPYVFSISYQDLEYTVSYEYARRVNIEIMKNSMIGRTFVTGSGDWGVGCKKDYYECLRFVSDFPSCSPWFVSLGATKAPQDNSEIGVYFSSGGFSNYFGAPAYQNTAVQGFLNQPNKPPNHFYNATGRAFPDIAAIGFNFQIFVGGKVQPVGGTSASTPTFASIISMINSLRLEHNLPTMGHINPFLYKAAASFKDITEGETQLSGCCPHGFETVVGWDPYTGLGTPNFGLLSDLALDGNFNNFGTF
eukprot:TRINITY_DN12157_c0_g1_i1.p1 TRINITY_DN12157_c0_g1~~TRINITY_DN12157_c0_g1_i1.p1  ORF type:complete len:575 (-),score=110.53 TRINITY_DN12157_c0_g1_i1:32-1702(-)